MTERTPVERVVDEGASPAVVHWVGVVERIAPALGPLVGFWASVYARFARHRGSVLAGGLAFFGLLSLVPAVISLGAVVALLADPAQLAEDLQHVASDWPDGGALLQPIASQLSSIADISLGSIGLTGLVSLAISLYAASRFLYVGRQVLDIAFELDSDPPSLLTRVLAIAVTLLCQLAIAAALVALTVVPRVLDSLGIGELYSLTIKYLRLPLIVVVGYLLLTAALRFGTRARRVVGWASLGALVGTAIAALGTMGLGWFLSRSATYSQIVSVLGSVVALEIWLYVVGLAIVVAAETEGVRFFRRTDREILGDN